jgi:hypothetical protein
VAPAKPEPIALPKIKNMLLGPRHVDEYRHDLKVGKSIDDWSLPVMSKHAIAVGDSTRRVYKLRTMS